MQSAPTAGAAHSFSLLLLLSFYPESILKFFRIILRYYTRIEGFTQGLFED